MADNEELLGPLNMIRRSELVRIIGQCLYSLGYVNSADLLETTSGIFCKSEEFALLETNILHGNWIGCFSILSQIDNLTEENRDKALFCIFQECVMESLRNVGRTSPSETLWNLVSIFDVGPEFSERLDHELFHPNVVELARILDEGIEFMRRELVLSLKELMPLPVVLPDRRLERLVEIALSTQANNCLYSDDAMLLYGDHDGLGKFPTETIQTLTSTDIGQEVKSIQFSNKGEYLASILDNGSVLIWMVLDDNTVHQEHEINTGGPISFVSWSPDDSLLLIQLSENYSILQLWDVKEATITHSFAAFYVQCCAWIPSSRVFIGVCEERQIIHKINCDTLETFSFECKVGPIRNLAVTTRWGNWTFVWLSGDREIWIYSYPSDSWNIISETHDITSLSLSGDGNFLIVNIKNHEIHMWHLGGGWIKPVSYRGHRHRQCNLQSCFGGPHSRFIGSGSEDSQVYIWKCYGRSSPIAILSGHSNTVKCVSWNPRRPQMLASLSADRTIRIWGAKRSG